MTIGRWARNTAIDRTEYDGGGSKTLRTERTFDAFSNVTQQKDRGDTAVATDDK